MIPVSTTCQRPVSRLSSAVGFLQAVTCFTNSAPRIRLHQITSDYSPCAYRIRTGCDPVAELHSQHFSTRRLSQIPGDLARRSKPLHSSHCPSPLPTTSNHFQKRLPKPNENQVQTPWKSEYHWNISKSKISSPQRLTKIHSAVTSLFQHH